MFDADDLPELMFALLPELLLFIVLIVMMIIAVVQRRRIGGTASGLAASGLGLMALLSLFQAIWFTFGIRWVLGEWGFREYTTVIGVVGLVTRLIYLVGLGLVISAIFVRRPNSQAVPGPQPQQPVY